MTDAAGSTPDKPKWSKLLIASVALNLLFVGLIGGAFVARHRHGPPGEFGGGRMMGDPGLRGFVRQLPKERRVVIRQTAESARQTLKPLRQAANQARQDVAAALEAVPFDAARVEKAFASLIEAEATARRAGVQALVSAVSKMTPDERTQFQAWRRKYDHAPPPPRDEPGDKEAPPAAPQPVSPPK